MTADSAIPEPSDQPSVASAENGLVVVDGPLGIAVTMTVRAARETARNLMAAASIAEEQLAQAEDGSRDG